MDPGRAVTTATRVGQGSSCGWPRAEAGQRPKPSHPVDQIVESLLLVGCSLVVINSSSIYFVSLPIGTCTGLFLILRCSRFPSLFSFNPLTVSQHTDYCIGVNVHPYSDSSLVSNEQPVYYSELFPQGEFPSTTVSYF